MIMKKFVTIERIYEALFSEPVSEKGVSEKGVSDPCDFFEQKSAFKCIRSANKLICGNGMTFALLNASLMHLECISCSKKFKSPLKTCKHIVVVPNTVNVTSKLNKFPNTLCVYRGVTTSSIIDFIKSPSSLHILTTAASFSKVAEALTATSSFSSYRLFLDEYEVSYEPVYASAYTLVESYAHLFESAVSFTASPFTTSDVTLTEYSGQNVTHFLHIPSNNFSYITGIAHKELSSSKEVFVYVNSVNLIHHFLKALSPHYPDLKSITRILVGDVEINKIKLKGYNINSKPTSSTRLTISTSTAFRSVDMPHTTSSPVVLVYSNDCYGHTAVSSSDLMQISGRLRDITIPPIVVGSIVKRSHIVSKYIEQLSEAENILSKYSNPLYKFSPFEKSIIDPFVDNNNKLNTYYKEKLLTLQSSPLLEMPLIPTKLTTDSSMFLSCDISKDETWKSVLSIVYNEVELQYKDIFGFNIQDNRHDSSYYNSNYYLVSRWLKDHNFTLERATGLINSCRGSFLKICVQLKGHGCIEDWCEVGSSLKGKAVDKAWNKPYSREQLEKWKASTPTYKHRTPGKYISEILNF